MSEVEDNMHLSEEILDSSDVIFPVLSHSAVHKMHGFYFLDAYKAPSFFYFTEQKSSNDIIQEVMYNYTNKVVFPGPG